MRLIKTRMKISKLKIFKAGAAVAVVAAISFYSVTANFLEASSHREAPMIAYDPLADNTDLYAFVSPDDPNTVTIIANYIPFQLPEGGPNYSSFGENIRYEIHIKNQTTTTGDDITYRFTFDKANADPTTFFNIRFGENLKTTYTVEKSIAGGAFTTIKTGGVVPPPNIGPRSIENSGVPGLGLDTLYAQLMQGAVTTASTGEKIYCGPAEDPFFVDLGGVFDLGGLRKAGATGFDAPRDGVTKFNVHSIALQIPISSLQKSGKTVSQATNILDPDFVIGVWASASRQATKTLDPTTGLSVPGGSWVQVSRLGMPLTNEAIIPIGAKDRWNAMNPSSDVANAAYFSNPELALYMDDSQFGPAVPALAQLRIQSNSLGAYDFRNGKAGLYALKGTAAVAGTALDNAVFGNLLLPDNKSPRAVDILPIFYTGVPNLAPYQLATGKNGNPLAAGKPFINNFLPTLGDMLRLNMAVPPTPRTSPAFSPLGIVNAAVLGLTDPAYNTTTTIQNIPNMDGFPNGRRLEDDVTTIELQAVGGVALAAIGLWYNDYIPGTSPSPVTASLNNVLSFSANVKTNDVAPFNTTFPYLNAPFRGYDYAVRKGGNEN
jgi:hypothetical protein